MQNLVFFFFFSTFERHIEGQGLQLLEDLLSNINTPSAGCEGAYSKQQHLKNAYITKERKIQMMLDSSTNHQSFLFQPQGDRFCRQLYSCSWDMLLWMAQAGDGGFVPPCPSHALESSQCAGWTFLSLHLPCHWTGTCRDRWGHTGLSLWAEVCRPSPLK